jgi:hypothetical protein
VLHEHDNFLLKTVPLGTAIEPSRFATPVKPLSAHDAPTSNAYAERG